LAESQIELTLILPSSSMFLSVGKQISEMLNKGFQERPNFAVVVGEGFDNSEKKTMMTSSTRDELRDKGVIMVFTDVVLLHGLACSAMDSSLELFLGTKHHHRPP
jgi:hypothetical protein